MSTKPKANPLKKKLEEKDNITKKQKLETKAKPVEESSEEESDSSEEEVKVPVKKAAPAKSPKTAPAKKPVKAESSSEESSDEEIIVPAKKTAAAPAKAKAVVSKGKSPKTAPKKVEESSEESEESSEEAPAKPTTQTKGKSPKTAPVKKAPVKAESSEEESSEEESDEKPAKKPVAAKGKSPKVAAKPSPKVAPKKPATSAKKEESSDDSEESDEEEEVKPAPKAPVQAKKPAPAQATAGAEGEYEVKLFGLSFNASDNDVRDFLKDCGDITNVNLLKDRNTGRSRGIAFVKFSTEEGLNAALEMNNAEHMGRYIEISKPEPRQQGGDFGNRGGAKPWNNGAQGGENSESATCFVGNLSYNTTAESLRAAFEDCGEIVDARIATDKETGRPRGFGHIDFADNATAKKALLKAGENIDGRPIKVDLSAPKKDFGGNGGGRGGFGGGRGGRGGFGGGRGGRGGGFGGGRGGSILNENDRAAKKGSIVPFEGQKKKL